MTIPPLTGKEDFPVAQPKKPANLSLFWKISVELLAGLANLF
jgi:hypothetical protein